MTISFIVPLFFGKKYIPQLCTTIDDAQKQYGDVVEVILVNDSPSEPLLLEDCNFDNPFVKVVIVCNSKNIGIQQSRIAGIKKSCGSYIVMLDQDDKISPNYIKSQLAAIGDADAVVSNARHFNHLFYDSDECHDKVLNPQTYLVSNPIVSPGQVLIKREAIPREWIDNPLTRCGADDYYLWILMINNKKKIVVNREALYLHHISGGNYSYNMVEMEKSIDEMIGKLKDLGVWNEEQCSNRKKTLLTDDRDKLIHDSLNMMIIKEWLFLKQNNKSIMGFFESSNYKRIAVYGYGPLGTFLEIELRNSAVQIDCFVDRNTNQRTAIPVVNLDGFKQYASRVDCIVVSIVYDYEIIKASILAIDHNIKVISLLEILGGVITDLD